MKKLLDSDWLSIPGTIYGQVFSVRIICKALQPNMLYIGVPYRLILDTDCPSSINPGRSMRRTINVSCYSSRVYTVFIVS